MNGFYFKIYNGLLEPKHVKQMGEAVWLYMWFNEKCTSVNENGEGKILGNTPIRYEKHIKQALGISRQTYVRWVDKLRDAGYIQTLRTPSGLIMVITKAKKFAPDKKSDVPNSHITAKKGKSDVPKKGKSDVPNSSIDVPKKGKSDVPNSSIDVPYSSIDVPYSSIQYKIIQGYNKEITYNSTNVELGDQKSPDKKGTKNDAEKEAIKKLYYECIKGYKLPVLNHNTLRAKINAMMREDEPESIIEYLTFMRDQYQRVEMSYKPRISSGLDFYTKRVQIREAITDEVKSQTANKPWRPKSKGVKE